MKLKESEHIYASLPETRLKNPGPPADLVPGDKAEFRLPTNVKPGTYEVCLSVIQDGKVIAKQQPRPGGEDGGLSGHACHFGLSSTALTYGILAVVIAIITGFAMGFLFKGGGGH